MEIPSLADVRQRLTATKRHWKVVSTFSGVPLTTIHRLFHGLNTPRIDTVHKLTQFFDSEEYKALDLVINAKKNRKKT